jgi:phosphonate transport system substrate-binding protein
MLLLLGLLVVGCGSNNQDTPGKLTVGIVSYETGVRSVEKYESFKDYLAAQTHTFVELEPAFNELQAVGQVQRRAWSIVFAPPGLAAIAINREQYIPIFRMQGVNNVRSVLVVRENSPIRSLADLSNQVVALGQPGSAAGYYLPLYDLYGLTLAEVRFAPTPKTVLEWLSQDTIDAGGLSEDEFQRYRREFEQTFRILHKTRFIPPGVVLLGPTVDRNQQEQIVAAMKQAPPTIVGDAEYIPDAKVPNYEQFIQIVEKVRPLEAQVREKPTVLLPGL